jgi:hemoglobin
MVEPSLYERLGGVFAIAAVIDHFSDAVVQNPIVGQASKNPELREWHTNQLNRLPGLKFMRTLWVCNVAGGPLSFAATKPGSTPLGLEEAHRDLHITRRSSMRSLPSWDVRSITGADASRDSPAPVASSSAPRTIS